MLFRTFVVNILRADFMDSPQINALIVDNDRYTQRIDNFPYKLV